MSLGPLGIVGSIAGGISQIRGAEVDRAHKDAADHGRTAQADKQAEAAAGVGEMTEDEKTSDRDADGRKLWEGPPNRHQEQESAPESNSASEAPQSKDPTGTSGGQLDLSG